MEDNKNDKNEQPEEENPETFLKLKSLLDSRGIDYKLMEVKY
jgi:hypothetical protein